MKVRDGAIQRIRCGGTHVVIGQRHLGALQRMVRGAVTWHEEGARRLHQEVGLLEEGVACRGGLHELRGCMNRGRGGGCLKRWYSKTCTMTRAAVAR